MPPTATLIVAGACDAGCAGRQANQLPLAATLLLAAALPFRLSVTAAPAAPNPHRHGLWCCRTIWLPKELARRCGRTLM